MQIFLHVNDTPHHSCLIEKKNVILNFPFSSPYSDVTVAKVGQSVHWLHAKKLPSIEPSRAFCQCNGATVGCVLAQDDKAFTEVIIGLEWGPLNVKKFG